ncbi:MAG: hypothetical protein POELPBGB_00007 [Bacteroidia bacterium]|nr:hypothetical protein [Bacteroidia bacterium]
MDTPVVTAAAKTDSIQDVVKTDSPKVEAVKPVEEKTPLTQKETKPADKKKETKVADGTKKVIVDPNRETPETKGKTYRIKTYSIEGNILSIEVSYRGGCGQHNFELYSNGLLKKSLPPQIDVYLEHKKENETCSEDIKQTLQFDISPLRKPGNELIILNINSADNKAEWKL